MSFDRQIQLVECPRDAMQGWSHQIPTSVKVNYLNALLKVGFHTLDFGSFVSPKAIPQMADTKEVIPQLVINDRTKLLAIVANLRGAEEAAVYDEISYLGFPFSLSPTFQQRNTNSTMEESMDRVKAIQELCVKTQKKLVVYLSMGFGNPYGDVYNEDILLHWTEVMVKEGVEIISLADTVGLASPEQIRFALTTLIPQYPETTIGVHLHSTAKNWEEKLLAAFESGCNRFDGAMKGIGGCPMAQDDLVGNMDSEKMIPFFQSKQLLQDLDPDALMRSSNMALQVFQ
ncbi:hydroxymethylglutaryl-CoA lyase [Sediminibacterium sp. KACHI17]|uniref:Hydroxymethylglutaryl-CoA lyase n=1 Tax=Sediminibacterium sp. KACHI17 TaxID=1751071 RepID=A0AAT9GHC2_9BACT